MTHINISYGLPKWLRGLAALPSCAFLVLFIMLIIKALLDNAVDGFFYMNCILAVLSLILLLINLYISRAVKIQINDEHIDIHLPKQKKIHTEWVYVSKIDIDSNYIIFHVNGGKKKHKVDYLSLRYKDVKPLKDVVEHIAKEKNIPVG